MAIAAVDGMDHIDSVCGIHDNCMLLVATTGCWRSVEVEVEVEVVGEEDYCCWVEVVEVRVLLLSLLATGHPRRS